MSLGGSLRASGQVGGLVEPLLFRLSLTFALGQFEEQILEGEGEAEAEEQRLDEAADLTGGPQ